MTNNNWSKKIMVIIVTLFMLVGNVPCNVIAEDYTSDQETIETVETTENKTTETEEIVEEELKEELPETIEVETTTEESEASHEQQEPVVEVLEEEKEEEIEVQELEEETEEVVEQQEELEQEELLEEEILEQEEEKIEEETEEATEEETPEVDPNKQYSYRLIVGFSEEVNTREEDVVLGVFDKVVLIGFDSIEQLNEAKEYYLELAEFASIDGILSASDNESTPIDVDTAQSSASETASIEENPLTEASETDTSPINASSVIALIDTGASGSNVYQQLSVLGDDSSDDNGHGTSLAALIGELNPNAKLISIKALNAEGTGTVASVYVAIKLAIDSNVDYIVCPFSALGYSEAIRSVIVEATNKGIKVVVSAGNDGNSAINYCPANVEEAITVGALNLQDEIAEFSNKGSMVDAWVFATSTSEAAVILTSYLSLGHPLSYYERTFANDYDDVLPNPVDGDNVEFNITYKTTTDSLVDGGIYIIRLRKAPAKALIQLTGGYENGNKFVLSNGDKLETSGAQFRLVKINYNYYFQVRDNTNYIMSPEGGANNLGQNGQKVHMWKKATSEYKDFDQWWMKSNGNYFRITNGANTGMHLQTEGSGTAGGTYTHLWNATSGEQGDWIFERVYYNVKFNANGGSGSMSNQKFWQEESKALTSNAFTRTGYTFNGWNTNSSGTGTNYSNGQSVKTLTSTNAATYNLYAKWKANTYSVIYNGNGATSGSMSNSSHTYDTAKTLTSNAYSRTGYIFNGWNTKSDGTGTSYSNAQSVKNLTSTNGGSVTIYAQWTPITYSVKYNGNGSSAGSMSNSSHTYGVEKKLTANAFTKTGYVFNGWNTNTGGTGTSYSNTQSVKNLTSTNGGTFNLYAKWKPATYFVSYNGNGATGGSTIDSTHTYDEEGQLSGNGYTRTGYTFKCWNTRPDGTGTDYTDEDTVLNLSTTNNASVDLFAQWTPNTYTVKYNGNGATSGSTASSSHTWNEAKSLTANGFTKTGYTFVGWNSTATGTGTNYLDKDSVKNLTSVANGTYNLYAKWEANHHFLTLDSEHATTSGTTEVHYSFDTPVYYSDSEHQNVITKIENPTRTGYVFGGYFEELDGEGTQYIDENGNFVNNPYQLEDTTLYAKWTAISYTVSLDPNDGELVEVTENPFSATYDDEHMTIQHPIYEGYTFKGWNISNMEEGVSHDLGTETSTNASETNVDARTFRNLRASEGEVEFVAQWQANKYEVLFDFGNGSYDVVEATYDEEFTVASPTRDGFAFHGWKIDDMIGSSHIIDGIETSESDYVLETDKEEITFKNLNSHNNGEVDITAIWAESTYDVSFDLAGGTLDGETDPEAKTYEYAHSFTVLNPERSGYTFNGWTVEGMNAGSSHLVGGEEFTGEEKKGVLGTSFARLNMYGSEVTFTATWESDDITVILSAPEAKEGSEYTRRIYYTFDEPSYYADAQHEEALPENIVIPVRDNYIFTGYYDESNGRRIAIVLADGSLNSEVELCSLYPAPHNLYAEWEPVVYEIELSQEDATTQGTTVIYEKYNTGIYSDEQTTTSVNTITIPVKEVTVLFGEDASEMKAALLFDGYFDDEIELIGPAGQLLPAFEGTYFKQDSSIEARFSQTTIKLPTPTDKEGYTFDGWYLNDTKVGEANDSFAVSEDTQLHAVWIEDPVLVYDKNGDDATGEVANGSAKVGKVVAIAANGYERTGYVFTGWNSKADGSGTSYKANTNVVWSEELQDEQYTLYAQWQANEFVRIQDIDDQPFTGLEITTAVTVVDNNGSIVDPGEYELVWEDNIEVGPAKVAAKPKADGNYKASESVSATFNIVKAPYSQFNEKKVNYSGVYDGNDHVVMVTSNTEDDYHAYKIGYGLTEQEAEEEAKSASLSPINQGYTVKDVKDSGIIYYYIIPENFEEYSGTLTASITPKEITVTGISAQSRVYDGTTDVTLTGTATLSGVVAGDTVTLDDSGVTAVATNKNAGNQGVVVSGYAIDGADKDNYVLVQPDKLKITINKKPVSFTWVDASYTYDGTAKVYEGAVVKAADVVSGDNVTIASYSGNIETDAGNYTATVTALSGADSVNYSVGDDASRAWSIAKADNIVTVSMDDWTYGKQACEPTLTATYGKEDVVYQYSTDNNVWSDTKPTAAGTYYIKATIPAGDNYDEKSAVDTFVIEKADITVRANDATSVRKSESGLVENIGFEVSGDFVEADRSSLEALIAVTTNADNTKAGKYKTTAAYETSAVSANYNIEFEEGVYTVTRNNSTVTAEGYNGTYDGEYHDITVDVTGDDNPTVYYSSEGSDPNVTAALDNVHENYDEDDQVFNPLYNALAQALENSNVWEKVNKEDKTLFKDAGTNAVKYIVVTSDSKPDVIEGSRDVVINKAPLKVTAKDNAITYGGDPSGNGLTYDGFVNGEKENVLDDSGFAYEFNYEKYDDAGTYAITPKGLTAANYEITYQSGKLTVNPLAVKLTWSPSETEFTHNGSTYKVTAAVSNALNGDDVTVATYTNNVNSLEGEYTASADSLAGSKSNNYTLTNGINLTHKWSIVNKDNNVTVSIEGWNYGDTPNDPIVTADYNQNSAVVEYFEKNGEEYKKLTSLDNINVGTYYVKATVESDGYYLKGESDYVPFEISKKKISILIDNKVSRHGNTLLPLTYKLSDTLVNADDLGDIELSTEATKDSEANNYDITATYSENDNYEVTVTKGTYTITKAALTASVSGYTGEYDGQEHGITITLDPRVYDKTTIYYAEEQLDASNYSTTGSTDPITRKDAGSTTVYYYITSMYYETEEVSGSKVIEISKKPLTVTANDNEVDYGQDVTDVGVTYDGLIDGDYLGDVELSYSGYVKGEDAGTYDIEAFGLDDTNYSINYVEGTLTVNKLVAVFDWDYASFDYNGSEQSPTATVSNKLDGDDVTVGTYAGNTATNVGSYVAEAKSLAGAKADNYKISNSEASTTHNWKIVQVDNEWTTQPTIADWYYSKTASQPSAVSKFGGPVIFEYKKLGEEDRFYVSELQNPQAGTYVMRATVIRDDNFKQLSDTVEFKVLPLEVEVQIADVHGQYRNDIETLTYTIDDEDVDESELAIELSTTASLLSPVDEYPITGTWSNNPNYIVTFIDGTYYVDKAYLTIVSSDVTVTYDGQEHGIDVRVVYPTLNDAIIYYSNEPITKDNFDTVFKTEDPLAPEVSQIDVGEREVYYYVSSRNFDVNPEDTESHLSGSNTVKVNKHPLEIKINDQHITYGDNPITGQPHDYTEGVTYTIPAGGDDDIQLAGIKYVYDYVYEDEQIGDAGTYTIDVVANSVTSEKYEIEFVEGNLIVNPHPIKFEWVDENDEEVFAYTYDGSTHHVKAIPQPLYNDIIEGDLVYENNEASEAGSYVAKVTHLPSEGKAKNYTIDESEPTAKQPWTINKAVNEWIIEPTIESWTYGESPKTPVSKAKFGDTSKRTYYRSASGEWQSEVPSQAGDYEMRIEIDETDNYEFLDSEKEFFIVPAKITVKADSYSSKYLESLHEFTYSVTGREGDSFKEGDELDVEFESDVAAGSHVGKYAITPEVNNQDALKNYNIMIEEGIYTITRRSLSVDAHGYEGVYDGLEHGIETTINQIEHAEQAELYFSLESFEDMIEELDDLQTDTTGTVYHQVLNKLNNDLADRVFHETPMISHVYAAPTVVYYLLMSENYNVITDSKEIIITKAPLTVTANHYEITFGDIPADGGVTYDKFVNKETEDDLEGELKIEIAYNQFGDIDENGFAITAHGLESENYDIEYKSGKLNVNPLHISDDKITLTVDPVEFEYDGSEKAPTVSLVLNTKDSEGEDVSYELEEGKDYVLTGEKSSSEAGDHTFTIEGIGNFNSSIEQSYHIGKAPLTITANDHSIKFGDAPSDNGVTYDGLKDGDSEEDLDGELKISVDYKQFEDIDENGFDIVAQGLSSDNYDITYVSGKLTVEPIDMSDENIEMTIEPEEFTDDKTERRPQVTLTLNTKDKDGNDVSYTLVEGKDYTLSGDISSSEVGDHSIIATGTGNFKGTCEGAWTIKEKDDDEDIEKESFDVGNGKVVFETDVNAKGIAIKVTDLTKEVALAALSPEDIARIEAGETAYVYLEINVIDKLPEEDKDITEDKLDEISAKPCVYLDITLWKKVGNDPVESVSSMNNNEVTIDVEVPEEFHNRDKNIERNFYVLRAHEGVASVLAGPTTATTISFKTGLFSSYTIAYRDRIIDRPYVIPVTGVE